MIREFHLADWFTLGNAVCGVGALFSAMSYLETGDRRHIYFAAALVLAALIFDVLDGRIARWRQKSSAMGRELDSLADVISFGVAPAIIAYACGMQGLWDRVVLGFFVACGVSRLARYNVTAEELAEGPSGKVKYFEGTPIPTSIVLVAMLAVAQSNGGHARGNPGAQNPAYRQTSHFLQRKAALVETGAAFLFSNKNSRWHWLEVRSMRLNSWASMPADLCQHKKIGRGAIARNAVPAQCRSRLFDIGRFELHVADAIDAAVDIVVAIHQFDVAHLGADLHHQRRSLELEILDDGDAVAVLQHIAHRILDDSPGFFFRLRAGSCRPFMSTFRADQQGAVGIDEFGLALRAGWKNRRHE